MPSRLTGAIVVPLLLLAAIAAASAPLIAGILATALIPEWGELRTTSAWSVLHLFWIYPVLYLVAVIGEPLGRILIARGLPSALVRTVGGIVVWMLLTAMFSVYFEHPGGAAVSALVGLALVVLAMRLLERRESGEPPTRP